MTLIFIIECICIKYFNYFCYYCCSSTQCMTNQKLIFLLLTKSYCPTMDDCWIIVASSRMRGTFCRSARQHTVSLRRRPAIQAVWMMSIPVIVRSWYRSIIPVYRRDGMGTERNSLYWLMLLLGFVVWTVWLCDFPHRTINSWHLTVVPRVLHKQRYYWLCLLLTLLLLLLLLHHYVVSPYTVLTPTIQHHNSSTIPMASNRKSSLPRVSPGTVARWLSRPCAYTVCFRRWMSFRRSCPCLLSVLSVHRRWLFHRVHPPPVVWWSIRSIGYWDRL